MGAHFIGVKGAMGRVYKNFLNVPSKPTEEDELLGAIRNARKAYKMAENRFNEAGHSDLVDEAIYDMLSARTRYTYLMKQAKEQGLRF